MPPTTRVPGKIHLAPKKRLGQHFLVDETVARRIVDAATVTTQDTVVEIGPGKGVLTFLIAARARRVVAVEFDRNLVAYLREHARDHGNVAIVNEDVLRYDFRALARGAGSRLIVVANLPYNISTPVLFRLFDAREVFSHLVLMLQQEVADRVVACPGTKDYGVLAVFAQLFTTPRMIMRVPPGAFYPRPKVTSALVRFDILGGTRLPVRDMEAFRLVVRAGFGQRRKTLVNALHGGPCREASKERLKALLEGTGIDHRRRAETLDLAEFERLAWTLRSSGELSRGVSDGVEGTPVGTAAPQDV